MRVRRRVYGVGSTALQIILVTEGARILSGGQRLLALLLGLTGTRLGLGGAL